jgi:lysophospholipid acyltransferase (LPLAT)-like uncharacterized protein
LEKCFRFSGAPLSVARVLENCFKIEEVSASAQPRFTFGQRIALAVVPRIVWAMFSIIGRTWRFEVIAEEGVKPTLFGERSPNSIFCFWHQCVLPCTVYFRHSHAVILISRSFDGELITRTLRCFGYDAVRGSSSRGGSEGLRGLVRILESDRTAIFTADGPRGPIYQTKMGPVRLANLSGASIGVFHLEPEHAWTMKSWDRFLVPKPFTRIVVSWAKSVKVPADLDPEAYEAERQKLNDALERARLRALAHFGKTDQ